MNSSVASTILDLNWYVKVKRKNVTYFLYVTQDTTSLQIKRMLKQFVNRKVHDMILTVPRMGNRKFHDSLSLEQMILENRETLNLQLRIPGTDTFEGLDKVTGNYDTITTSLYR